MRMIIISDDSKPDGNIEYTIAIYLIGRINWWLFNFFDGICQAYPLLNNRIKLKISPIVTTQIHHNEQLILIPN
ncbi:hypothetical protein HYN51_06845 [Limnobaculum parvum]|uniref:Uncharacterized protein n=1 Tax=Limnobaculum parvum TaxID=2172103 RepID=A0A2Y9TXM9_9GAMM|nr:hypothetical protein HYN51_06845 [Limnobaculum parvum]